MSPPFSSGLSDDPFMVQVSGQQSKDRRCQDNQGGVHLQHVACQEGGAEHQDGEPPAVPDQSAGHFHYHLSDDGGYAGLHAV